MKNTLRILAPLTFLFAVTAAQPAAAQSCTDTMLASIGAITDSQVLDDGTYIYFGDETGRLLRVPLAGGNVQVLATIPGSGTIGVSGIYVDSSNAYFATNGKPGPAANPNPGTGSVWVVPLTGGTAVSLASGLSTVTQIKGDATNVYVAVAGTGIQADGQILSFNKASQSKQILAQGLVTPISLDVDSTNVYFGQYPILGGTGGVARVAKTGGSVSVINSSKPAYYVALDFAGNIFFTSGAEQGVYKANLSSGALTTLASGVQFGSVEALPVNGYALYSTDNNCGTGVGVGAQFSYVSATGGGSTLYKTSNCASFFTVDNVAMYASVRPSTSSGQIWKFCLPPALASTSGGNTPTVPSTGVVGGASYTASLTAAGITSIFGTNFASGNNVATTLPLPTTLGGVTVKLNGVAAPLFFVGAGQINFEMPWEVLGQTTATLTVTNAAGTSTPLIVSLSGVAPGIFSIDSSGKGQGAIQLANSSTFAAPAGSIPGASAQPVSRGSYLTIYCSGLGAVSNQPATGAAASGSTLSMASGNVTATIGGQSAPVSFAGLAPGFVGLYQVNAQVPQSVTPGSAVSLSISVNGVASNSVTIAVQ